jgi:K(+)-stimulated pyrophosphate-energized sodium pump
VLIGLVAGQVIGTATEYYTAYEFSPTQKLAAQAVSGTGPVIIGGLALGMLSTAVPLLTIVAAIWLTYALAGLYGIALAAVGMLSTLGITLATDAYGPVADNAGGIAEQAHLPPEVRERTDALDSLGNTTAATGKGFAIGSAVLTALALMVSYSQITGVRSFNLLDVEVLLGLLIGALMPFLFGALTMGAVGRAAMKMVEEVRRQFREIPGIMEGTTPPDAAGRCGSRPTAPSGDGLPGAIAVIVPIAVGITLGAEALGGLLVGSIGAGALLALMMANAGGAWDNAKKYIEKGHHGGKNSEAHRAGGGRRHGGGPVQGHVRAEPEHPAEAHGDRGGRVRAAVPVARRGGPGRAGEAWPLQIKCEAWPLQIKEVWCRVTVGSGRRRRRQRWARSEARPGRCQAVTHFGKAVSK